MYKVEQYTPLDAVDIEKLPDGKSRVILRDNFETKAEVYFDEKTECTLYTADEVAFITSEEVTFEYVSEHFVDLWYYAENGETRDEKYARLVNAYVREAYSQSAVEAIINNYLSDPTNEKYKSEFDALQEYREQCKVSAKAEVY